jgi:hypothetical protein
VFDLLLRHCSVAHGTTQRIAAFFPLRAWFTDCRIPVSHSVILLPHLQVSSAAFLCDLIPFVLSAVCDFPPDEREPYLRLLNAIRNEIACGRLHFSGLRAAVVAAAPRPRGCALPRSPSPPPIVRPPGRFPRAVLTAAPPFSNRRPFLAFAADFFSAAPRRTLRGCFPSTEWITNRWIRISRENFDVGQSVRDIEESKATDCLSLPTQT